MAEEDRRQYGHCAGCGKEKPLDTGYQCNECLHAGVGMSRTPGTWYFLYSYCAVCGGWMFEDHSMSRRYVHNRCKVRNVKAPRSAKAVPVGSVCPVCFQVKSAAGTCGCLD